MIRSPFDQWSTLPSFLIGEYLFYLCALAALLHALSQPGPERRRHLAIWFGALLAGTVNDLVFMALPLVDNFWHAQATVMLTPRLPLYIPCVYIWFMYVPTVVVLRWRLPLLAHAALAGLVAILIYAPFDVVGAKYLWWTWHDTDAPIADRWLGVPASSSMWVIIFVATLAAIAKFGLGTDGELSLRRALLGTLAIASCSTLGMVLQMTLVQQLTGGVPTLIGLLAVIALYALLVAVGIRRSSPMPSSRDRLLLLTSLGYFATLSAITLFAPEAHRSTGVHQTIGECYAEAADITGLTRYEYLCTTDFDEDFTFACLDAPPAMSEWYTICGRPYSNPMLYRGVVLTLGAAGTLALAALTVARRRQSMNSARS